MGGPMLAMAAKQGAEQAAKQGAEKAAQEGAEQAAQGGTEQGAKNNTAQTSSLSPQPGSSSQLSGLSERFKKLSMEFPELQPTETKKQSEDVHNAVQTKVSGTTLEEPRTKVVEEIEGFLSQANSGLQHNALTDNLSPPSEGATHPPHHLKMR